MNYAISLDKNLGWLPLPVLTAFAWIGCRDLAPWALMWALSIALFAGFKWWTFWWIFAGGLPTTTARCLAYLFLWPGMDARRFLSLTEPSFPPTWGAWTWAVTKTALGAALVWIVARWAGHGLLAGWIGMVGFIFLLHFGLFALLALFWQRLGICAPPLMHCPIVAASLGEFWGQRWNAGFRDIVFGLFFRPFARRFGVTVAAILTFFLSGALHELVITFPAGIDYGLPTLYFTVQGIALLAERSRLGAALGLKGGWMGHLFALAVVVLPIFALFPPAFVLRVMVPFLHIIQALP